MKLLLLLALLPAAAAAESVTVTREQLDTMPPEQMHRLLRDLVWDMTETRDIRGKRQDDPSSIRVDTKVQPALVPGLCRYDSLFLMLRPAADGGYKVRNIVVNPHFRFLTPPTNTYGASWYTGALNPECERLDNDRGFFEAGNEETATDGYRAYLMLHAALRAGQKLPIDCGVLGKAECNREAILALKPEDIEAIGGCEDEPDGLCHRIAFGWEERTVEVVLEGGVEKVARARMNFLGHITTAAGTKQ